MNQIEELKEEHEEIERELIEFEEIIGEERINYPNLLHVYKKLLRIWELHETKEEILFDTLEKKGIVVPIQTLRFEHVALKTHRDKILEAMNSGSEFELKKTLHTDLEIIISKLRKHIQEENYTLYSLPQNLRV